MRAPMLLSVLLPGLISMSLWTVRADDDKALKLSKEEQTILDLTNAERKKEGLPLLKANLILFQVARSHSANMAKQSKLEHKLDDKSPAQRIKEAGYKHRSMGENIALGEKDLDPAGALKIWMDSKGHKANILSKSYQEIGIGIVVNDKGEKYFTQVFGRRGN